MRRRRVILIATVLGSVAMMAAVRLFVPRQYKASSTIVWEQPAAGVE
jgi:uncharacterized protein involved in exopolysaccharide biosynthesis